MQTKTLKTFIVLSLLAAAVAAFFFFNTGMRIKRHFYGVAPGVTLENRDVSRWLEDEVEAYVLKRAEELKVEPRNAFFDRSSGDILPEVKGRFVNIRSTVVSVMGAEKNSHIDLALIYVDPEITRELLESLTVEIGSFITYTGGGSGRVENIRLATEVFNYRLVAPGQTLSFNKTTGPTTAEKGYKLAPIIVGGRIVDGLGGGICQVSTTLFNAVDEAGLQVVERYQHSKPVGYVPKGRDATVSHHLDFKFRNNTNKYILIRAWTDYRINFTILTH